MAFKIPMLTGAKCTLHCTCVPGHNFLQVSTKSKCTVYCTVDSYKKICYHDCMELEEDIPITEINAASESFNFLKDEPELYSLKDLKPKKHARR